MFFFELGLLFFILGYQTFLIVGAIYVKGHINEMHEGVNNIVLKTSNHANKTINDIEDTMQKNNKKFPFFLLLKQIGIEEEICHMEEYGHSTIDVVADYLHNTINYYILRRIIWIIGFSGMTLGIIFLFDRRKQILTPHNDFNTNCIDEYDNNFDYI